MVEHESPETVLSERDFLWKKCNLLYNAVSQNGAMSSGMFRQAIGMAGNLFQGKGVNVDFSNKWFEALADFMEMVEKGRIQKVGPKC